jgi:hypothetical protein
MGHLELVTSRCADGTFGVGNLQVKGSVTQSAQSEAS